MRYLWLAVAVVLLVGGPCQAGLQEGVSAYEQGDYATALRELRPLAEYGEAEAQFTLGLLYHAGQGVPQDYATARHWFRQAAAQGHAEAQFTLGVLYDAGYGVARDAPTAAHWFRQAAEQGHVTAQLNLGALYALGRGVPHDAVHAYLWFHLAAAYGEGEARKQREIAAERMTPAQIAEAQRLAREWMQRQANPSQ